MTTTALAPHELVWGLTNGVVVSRCLQTVAALGVADLIGDVPVGADQLAAGCGCDPDALRRVLDLLAAHGVFQAQIDGGYGHTDASRLLRTDHSMSMQAFAHMMSLPGIVQTFGDLSFSLRTGKPAITASEPEGLWGYLTAHPDEQEVFGRAMTAKAAADTAAVLAAYDFSASRRIVDVGGGRGHLLHAVLSRHDGADGVLFDLPPVVSAGGAVHPRLSRVAGDFFLDPVPAGDTYLLMEVLHDWNDTDATAILRAVRAAAQDGSRVLIIENVLGDDATDPRGRILDVIMLVVTGGRERTPEEFDALLHAAGLSRTRVIDTNGPLRIVEAIPVRTR